VATALECLAQCYRAVWSLRPADRLAFVLKLHAHAHSADTVVDAGASGIASAEAQKAVAGHAHDLQVRAVDSTTSS